MKLMSHKNIFMNQFIKIVSFLILQLTLALTASPISITEALL